MLISAYCVNALQIKGPIGPRICNFIFFVFIMAFVFHFYLYVNLISYFFAWIVYHKFPIKLIYILNKH